MKNIKIIVALFSSFILCSSHTVVGNWLERHADNHLTYGEKNAHQGLFRVDGAYIAYTKEEMESDTVYGSAGFVFYPDGICADLGLHFVMDNGIVDFEKSLGRDIIYPKQWHVMMGVYEVRNGIVYCDMYRWADLLHISTSYEKYEFVIKDSCTLECNRTMSRMGDFNWHFVPCTNIVHPREKFIKDRKWMWKTEEDWLKYKESKKEVR